MKVVRQRWHLISSWRVGDHCVLGQLVVAHCVADRWVAEVGHDKGSCSTDGRSMRNGDRKKDPRNPSIEQTCQEEGRSLAK